MSDFEKEKQAFELRCVECGENKNLTMLPHRDKDGNMVGVLYACEKCRETVQGSECIIDARRDEEIADLKDENENLRQESLSWAQEAKTQRSTVREIYQVITGATGEPGDWNGAQPVKAIMKKIAALKAEIERKDAVLRKADFILDRVGVFVKSKEKIKKPDGREWFDEQRKKIKQALQGEEE
jgi:hypothetical protein